MSTSSATILIQHHGGDNALCSRDIPSPDQANNVVGCRHQCPGTVPLILPLSCWLNQDIRQIATCFIVCNILVIVTYLYRVLGYRAEDLINTRTTEKDSSVENDGSPARLSVPHQMTLTTVELLFSVQSREGGLIAAEENVPRPSSTVGISS